MVIFWSFCDLYPSLFLKHTFFTLIGLETDMKLNVVSSEETVFIPFRSEMILLFLSNLKWPSIGLSENKDEWYRWGWILQEILVY